MSERPRPGFTMDELAQEAHERYEDLLRIKSGGDDEGYSVKEWAELWGVGARKAQYMVGALREAGEMIRGTRLERDCSNRLIQKPVYRLKEKE